MTFAAKAHAQQKRKFHGVPYVNHLLRVAEQAVLAELSDEAVAAALLHDVLEDTKTSERDLRKHFPKRVVTLVKLLTKWWTKQSPAKTIKDGMSKYYTAILKNSEATDLKLLDRADNISDYVGSLPQSRKDATRYLYETRIEFPPLFNKSKNKKVKATFSKSLKLLEEAVLR